MTVWMLVALVGGVLTVAAFLTLIREYRRGEIRGRYLLAVAVGYISLASFALLSAFAPTVVNGVVTLVILLPAFVAIVVLVREHEKTSRAGR